jgi:hypothetical protein
VVAIITLACTLLWQIWRQHRSDAPDQAALNLLLSQYVPWAYGRACSHPFGRFGALYACLLVSDLLQAIGFAISFEWILEPPLPGIATTTCTGQGVLIQIGDVASALFVCPEIEDLACAEKADRI